MTLPKRSACRTCACSEPGLGDLRAREVERTSPAGSSGSPASASGVPAARCAATGREQVAAVEARRQRARARAASAPMSTASATPPKCSAASVSSPLSGPTSTRSLVAAQRSATARRSEPTPGSTTARCTPAGMYGSARAQHERARAHLVARDAVRDVDDARVRRDARDDAVADADEVVREPVVAEERHHGHRRPSLGRPAHRSPARASVSRRASSRRVVIEVPSRVISTPPGPRDACFAGLLLARGGVRGASARSRCATARSRCGLPDALSAAARGDARTLGLHRAHERARRRRPRPPRPAEPRHAPPRRLRQPRPPGGPRRRAPAPGAAASRSSAPARRTSGCCCRAATAIASTRATAGG